LTPEFVALLVVLIACELVAAWLAYYTLGAIASALLFFAATLNVVPLVLYALGLRTLALVVALGLFVAIAPNQALLGQRFLTMQAEGARIVAYAYDTRQQTGAFPADLSQYLFQNAQVSEYLHDYRLSDEHGGFYLSFHVGTPNTEHAYTPKTGWVYYPD
jgi:hypothetical protein